MNAADMIEKCNADHVAIEAAERAGRGYARDNWSNVDNACASWLASGSSSAAAVVAMPYRGRMAAEAAFNRGFRAQRAK